MLRHSRQGFVLSVILHIVLVAAAIVLSIVNPPRPKPPAVFELVSMPAPSEDVSPADSAIEFSMPQVQQPPPPPPRPKPPPPPPPVQQTIPVRPKPKPPEPDPEPPPKPMTKEEYDRIFGPRKTREPRQTKPKPVSAPRINTEFTATIRETMVNLGSLGPLTDTEQSAWDRYIARLRDALRRSWDKPSGLAHNISAVIEFDVSSNGRLSDSRITKASGISEFDQSVLRAISSLGSAGATPDGRAQRLRLTFRMTDQ